MKVLQFKTQQEFDEWLNDNELFECYDKDMNLLGHILGPDADLLVSFKLAEINMTYRYCQITKELDDKQLEELNKNRLVKTIVTGDLFVLTPEQRVIIRRLRKDFDDARKVGLRAVCNDDGNKLIFFNGNAFDEVTNEDNLSGEWKNEKFVPYSDEYKSHYVMIDEKIDCEWIEGDDMIDFMDWGSAALPWYARLKDV